MSSSHSRDISDYHVSVIQNPPSWEFGVYLLGFLVLLGIVGVNLWKLWRSGSFPAPSPYPNFNYRYLQEKYGTSYSEVRQKCVAASNHRRASSASRKPSLQLADTPDSFRELGPLELMSRDLEMKRSASVDSLCSISSIAQTFGHDVTVGQLEVTLELEARSSLLHVTLHQAKDLMEKEEENFPGCYVTVTLLPDEINVGVTRHGLIFMFSIMEAFVLNPYSSKRVHSQIFNYISRAMPAEQIQSNAFTVLFDERLSIPLEAAAVDEYSLRFSAFGVDLDERNISAGQAELKLSDLDLSIRPFNAWLYLQDINKAVDAVGEVLLSLSYLPTAERLTVVVAKAKNLVWTNGKTTADPFVKVYLLQDGRKISKKKTSIKRDDTNPIFNEAMIFSVPAVVLQDLSLRVTVAENTEDGRGENVGHVIIGPEASGMGITHWNQMLATLRKPVSMWHPLRRT